MALYEIILIGSLKDYKLRALYERIDETAKEFRLRVPDDIIVRDRNDISSRDIKAATVALYFGGDPSVDVDLVDQLELAKVPIVPVLFDDFNYFAGTIPSSIGHTNAHFVRRADDRLDELAALALEMVGLLHSQRRVFVSYRRTESREVAVQLHDELSAFGFDVFLDTHDIRPGQPFQEVLWHRLSDCDVTIMLDTRDYFQSKWTTEELGRTLAHGIHILRLVWPEHSGAATLSLSETIQLTEHDLESDRLSSARIIEVVRKTELLRSRSIARRHLDLVGQLKSELEKIGGTFEGIGAFRAVSMTLPSGKQLEAYPMVGVPTANLLNDIQLKASKAGHGRFPCLVYSHIGIRPLWLEHLAWLDSNIASVKTLKVSTAGEELQKWL